MHGAPHAGRCSRAPLLTGGAVVFVRRDILQIQAARGSRLERIGKTVLILPVPVILPCLMGTRSGTCSGTCSAPCVAALQRTSLRGGTLHNSKAERCRKVLRKEHSQPSVATIPQARVPSSATILVE